MSPSVFDANPPQLAAPQQENAAPSCLARALVLLGEIVVLIGLSLYIVSGAAIVPFHGDESTILFTTRDVSYLLNNQMEHIFYSPTPEDIGPSAATEQELRLLNGTVARYVYGYFAINLETGRPLEPINEQWDWGADFAYNVETGHMPTPLQLNRARLISSVFLVGAMLSLYGLTRLIGGPAAAMIAVVYFTFNPAVLINGRRAMMESSWLFFGLLGLWMAAWLCERIRGVPPSRRGRRLPFMSVPFVTYLRLGGTLGLALASKHTALFYVAAIIGAVTLAPLWAKRPIWLKHIFGMPFMIAVMIGMFLLLNPAWWGDPVGRLNEVLRLRADLLAGQTATFGGYADTSERLTGLIRQAFVVQPQYYEVANWKDFIADQITAYEASGWQGVSIGGSMVGALVVIGLVMIGVITSVRALFTPKPPVIETILDPAEFLSARKKAAPASIAHSIAQERTAKADAAVIVSSPAPVWPSPMGAWVALWLGLAGIAAAIATPLEWQRYYLPLYPAIAVFLGVGVMAVLRGLTNRRVSDRSRDAVISL